MVYPWSKPYPVHTVASVAEKEFDYVIVGGGTAGCVLAARLSEDPNTSVLLLERGLVVDSWLSYVPLLSADFSRSGHPSYKWPSAPSEIISSSSVELMTGKAMGGTSKINAHLYTRSLPGEYNAWAASGRAGWSWDEVEPHFNKSETALTHGKSPHRGAEGPWQNRRLEPIFFKSVEATIEAATALGIPYVPEANDPSAPAVSCVRLDATIDREGYRQSVFDAFLPIDVAVQRRANLFICTGVMASSLDVEDSELGPKAVGVYIEEDGEQIQGNIPRKYRVAARHEVILCSGAIGTPQLLLLSGIGPEEHSESLNIPVKRDLRGVGSHLQDHFGASVVFKAPKRDTMHALIDSIFILLWHFVQYLLFGTGLFLSPNPQIAIFARSELLDNDSHTVTSSAGGKTEFDGHVPSNLPDIELMPIPCNATDLKFKDKMRASEGCFSLLAVALRPASTGTVRLASPDPRARPDCDLNSLHVDSDRLVMRRAVRLALAIGRTVRANGYPLRELQVPTSNSDEDVDAFVRRNARTTYHYSSTCRMAPEAEGGVVDDELRVYGMHGLRIADASVFPTIPACHLQAPTVMIAERCAAFIIAGRER